MTAPDRITQTLIKTLAKRWRSANAKKPADADDRARDGAVAIDGRDENQWLANFPTWRPWRSRRGPRGEVLRLVLRCRFARPTRTRDDALGLTKIAEHPPYRRRRPAIGPSNAKTKDWLVRLGPRFRWRARAAIAFFSSVRFWSWNCWHCPC
jgi:hypothetical protein